MRSTLPAFNEVWQCEFRKRLLAELSGFEPSANIVLACSGGMDSILLLYLLAQLIPDRLTVISVDHQLQDQSSAWCEFVAKRCAALAIPCQISQVTVAAGNLEAQARVARYQVLTQQLQANDVLVLAHHQQDQAETLLLRLFQGTGIQGLVAMRRIESRCFEANAIPSSARSELLSVDLAQPPSEVSANHYQLWRPLLDISKSQIQYWCTQLQLEYVDDPMNQQLEYDRVWCRQQLWPVLEQRFVQMQNNIARCARLMQDGQEILNDVLAIDWQRCVDQFVRLRLCDYQQLSAARQRQLLSRWMQGQRSYRPSLSMVEHLQQQVIAARDDAQAVLHFDDLCFVRYANHLYRYPLAIWRSFSMPVARQQVQLQLGQTLAVALGQMQIDIAEFGLDRQLLQQPLQLLPRVGGERILFWRRDGHRTLKKMLQEAKIAPWLRHQTQILMYHNVVLGVVCAQGFWLADSPYVTAQGWLPQIKMDLSDRV